MMSGIMILLLLGGFIIFRIVGPLYLDGREEWRKRKALVRRRAELAEKRTKILAEAEKVFAGLKRPFDGPLNEKQVKILVFLLQAEDTGLLLNDIARKVWGWDGSEVDFFRFLKDWLRIWRESTHLDRWNWAAQHRAQLMILGPIDDIEGWIGDATGKQTLFCRYCIYRGGLSYLAEHEII